MDILAWWQGLSPRRRIWSHQPGINNHPDQLYILYWGLGIRHSSEAQASRSTNTSRSSPVISFRLRQRAFNRTSSESKLGWNETDRRGSRCSARSPCNSSQGRFWRRRRIQISLCGCPNWSLRTGSSHWLAKLSSGCWNRCRRCTSCSESASSRIRPSSRLPMVLQEGDHTQIWFETMVRESRLGGHYISQNWRQPL